MYEREREREREFGLADEKDKRAMDLSEPPPAVRLLHVSVFCVFVCILSHVSLCVCMCLYVCVYVCVCWRWTLQMRKTSVLWT